MVEKERGELEAMVLEQHKAAGIEGFREAVRSNLLEVHPFRQTSAAAIVEATIRGGGNLLRSVDLADLLGEFLDHAMDAVEDPSTYPLFDDLTGDFIGEAVSHGLLTPTEASTARGRYGGISADLLRHLPMFEEASLSDVLAIRRELEGRSGASDSRSEASHARSSRRPGSRAFRRRRTPSLGRRSNPRSRGSKRP